jgi:hypothetical protein
MGCIRGVTMARRIALHLREIHGVSTRQYFTPCDCCSLGDQNIVPRSLNTNASSWRGPSQCLQDKQAARLSHVRSHALCAHDAACEHPNLA